MEAGAWRGTRRLKKPSGGGKVRREEIDRNKGRREKKNRKIIHLFYQIFLYPNRLELKKSCSTIESIAEVVLVEARVIWPR